ncbi:hypothetical protein NQ318_004852 [Aromia moschata]|uniref:Uncharacterized protein n=1 Tax=Aromia moschata TaxID=1265417 RepID=A0AAV8YZT5_9CUCU|nr:hypothetical protein NQ318_004852 [Aromia moschata]
MYYRALGSAKPSVGITFICTESGVDIQGYNTRNECMEKNVYYAREFLSSLGVSEMAQKALKTIHAKFYEKKRERNRNGNAWPTCLRGPPETCKKECAVLIPKFIILDVDFAAADLNIS